MYGRFTLRKGQLGSGGQAIVRVAEDERTGEQVALKICKLPDMGLDRFRREVDVQRRIPSVHIMPIIDAEPGECSWYAMPIAVGHLSKLRNGDDRKFALALLDVAAGLRSAHSHQIIHRDIKPSNVLELEGLNGERRWVLADFGLARTGPESDQQDLTETNQFLGSRRFASPEQLRDARMVTTASDMYSLGRLIEDMIAAPTSAPETTATAVIPMCRIPSINAITVGSCYLTS
jgi:serine/threonine protein kinase